MTILLEMKPCNKCNLNKDVSEFFNRKTSKDGLDYICKDCKRQNDKFWRENNSDKKSVSNKTYRDKNKEKMRSYFAEYRKAKRRSDPLVKLRDNLSKRMRKALNGIAKSQSTTEMLGSSIEEVKKHIESQFKSGMTWENYGEWHIDHIKPVSSGHSEVEIIELFHFSNLQPLWAVENLKKGSKYQEIA